jgi:GST-like protein
VRYAAGLILRALTPPRISNAETKHDGTRQSESPQQARPLKDAHARPHRPIELYFWPTYNGLKISIMLEECELPYEIKGININRGEQFDPAFPVRSRPTIAFRPLSIRKARAANRSRFSSPARSSNILAARPANSIPRTSEAALKSTSGCFGNARASVRWPARRIIFREYAREQIHYAIDRYTNEMNRLYGVMNKQLVDRDFLAGEYSIADMACWGVVKKRASAGQTLEDFPNVNIWWERMNARPGVQRGSTAGDFCVSPIIDAPRIRSPHSICLDRPHARDAHPST